MASNIVKYRSRSSLDIYQISVHIQGQIQKRLWMIKHF